MVLDLVVEAAVPEVGDRVGDDVAAGRDLPAQEVHPAVLAQHGHCFVVGREDRDHVRAEEPAMDGATNSTACKGSSTANSRPKYSAKCATIMSAPVHVFFAFFPMRNSMLLRCMLSACSSESGKIRPAWYFTTKRARPRLLRAALRRRRAAGCPRRGPRPSGSDGRGARCACRPTTGGLCRATGCRG